MFPEDADHKEKLTFFREKVTLYPVSCEPLANGRSDIDWLEGVLAGERADMWLLPGDLIHVPTRTRPRLTVGRTERCASGQ